MNYGDETNEGLFLISVLSQTVNPKNMVRRKCTYVPSLCILGFVLVNSTDYLLYRIANEWKRNYYHIPMESLSELL